MFNFFKKSKLITVKLYILVIGYGKKEMVVSNYNENIILNTLKLINTQLECKERDYVFLEEDKMIIPKRKIRDVFITHKYVEITQEKYDKIYRKSLVNSSENKKGDISDC